ncbi:MAG: PH domain-containing protein [Terriglobia bacterium]
MEFRYPTARRLYMLVLWSLGLIALLWWYLREGGSSYLLTLAPVLGRLAWGEIQRLSHRVRVDAEGIRIEGFRSTQVLAWKDVRKLRLRGWGPEKAVEFDAGEKQKLTVYTSLENYELFASMVQQWLPAQAERPESLLG